MTRSPVAVVAFVVIAACQPQSGSLSEADLAAIRSLPAAFDQVVLGGDVEFTDIDGCGDLAYARGTYSERFTVAGVAEPIRDVGKVLGILRKESDGRWLFSIWSSSTDLPAVEGDPAEGGESSF